MKKLLCLAMVLMMLCGAVCAQADTLYHMPELEMNMKIPNDWVILTRETSEVEYAALGIDMEAVKNIMSVNDTYMIMMPEDFSHEIHISMGLNDVESFDLLSNEMLNKIMEYVGEHLEEMLGVVVDRFDRYSSFENRYIRYYYHVPGEVTTYVVQYYTIQNNKAINFRMFTYGDEATESQLAEMDALMYHVTFD